MKKLLLISLALATTVASFEPVFAEKRHVRPEEDQEQQDQQEQQEDGRRVRPRVASDAGDQADVEMLDAAPVPAQDLMTYAMAPYGNPAIPPQDRAICPFGMINNDMIRYLLSWLQSADRRALESTCTTIYRTAHTFPNTSRNQLTIIQTPGVGPEQIVKVLQQFQHFVNSPFRAQRPEFRAIFECATQAALCACNNQNALVQAETFKLFSTLIRCNHALITAHPRALATMIDFVYGTFWRNIAATEDSRPQTDSVIALLELFEALVTRGYACEQALDVVNTAHVWTPLTDAAWLPLFSLSTALIEKGFESNVEEEFIANVIAKANNPITQADIEHMEYGANVLFGFLSVLCQKHGDRTIHIEMEDGADVLFRFLSALCQKHDNPTIHKGILGLITFFIVDNKDENIKLLPHALRTLIVLVQKGDKPAQELAKKAIADLKTFAYPTMTYEATQQMLSVVAELEATLNKATSYCIIA